MTGPAAAADRAGRFQILALDGGGAKALFSAHVLARLEADLGIRVADAFDLITGTSAGGIIALALGAGLRPGEIAAQYQSLVATVFPRSRRRWWRFPGRLTHPAYDASVLRRALEGVLGTCLLGDSGKRLVIPSWDVQTASVHLFKTPHHDRLRRDWKIPMVDVAMATSAAPTYFAAAHVDGHRLVDGGVWANNPSVVGITEAVSMLGVPLAAVAVLNIGTMDQVAHHARRLDTGGLATWARSAVPLVLTAGSRGAQGIAEHLAGTRNYSRFDAIVPGGLYALDDADPADLAAYAATASRNLSPVFTARFAAHRAPAYTPPTWPARPPPRPAPAGQISRLTRRTQPMHLDDHFDVLLKDTVNLSQSRLDLLDSRVTAIHTALHADPVLGPYVLGKIPQGSWAHRTIINPVAGREFDADVMLLLEENPAWSASPKTYIEQVYQALSRHGTYGGMPRSRKCRCVRLTYAGSCHVDIVPYLTLAGGRQVIVNRDNDQWEDTNPEGFTAWMREKDQAAGGNLRRVIRLMKYLRDHKNSFTGTRSVILTTLLGEQVSGVNQLFDSGYYNSTPTALVHIVNDLDAWLQARPLKPSVPDPSGSGVTFDHRWDQATYGYFRDRIHAHAAQMQDAYDEPGKDASVAKWQAVFGDGFTAPAPAASSGRFGTAAGAAAFTTGRSGRAG